jgi:hypothetical protein
MANKLLFSFALFFLVFTLKASHNVGGDIQYRYIGDSTGIPHNYEVYLRLYASASGNVLGSTANVVASSSCYPDITITCVQIPGTGPGYTAPAMFDCVDTSSSNLSSFDIWAYRGTVILPGLCADFKFYWSLFTRPPGITNMPLSSSRGFYIDAELNNFAGNNSSPLFVNVPFRIFCVGNNFNWKHTSLETDGDSVHYSLINCREFIGNGPVDIPFNPGWTGSQPISTSSTPPGTLILDNEIGNINFTPTQQEIDAMSVLIEEYRYDSTFNIYVKIGSSSRDMMVQIAAVCSSTSQQSPSLDFTSPNIYQDSITGLATVNVNCNDTGFALEFDTRLDCFSIAGDGSDFFLLDQNTLQPVPIISANKLCDANGHTREIFLTLFKPLTTNGDYYLTVKTGTDLNGILNSCGYPMTDTIIVRVQNCTAVGIHENASMEIDLYPNPTTGIVNIDLRNTKASSLALFSNTGQKLLSRKTGAEKMIQLDLTPFESGVYVLQLNSPEGAFYKRIVTQ